MGQGTAEAVARIAETRARLDAEVQELQRRLPPMVERAKKTTLSVGAAVAGSVVLLLTMRGVARRRRSRKAEALAA
jgi:hypothetical protein